MKGLVCLFGRNTKYCFIEYAYIKQGRTHGRGGAHPREGWGAPTGGVGHTHRRGFGGRNRSLLSKSNLLLMASIVRQLSSG